MIRRDEDKLEYSVWLQHFRARFSFPDVESLPRQSAGRPLRLRDATMRSSVYYGAPLRLLHGPATARYLP